MARSVLPLALLASLFLASAYAAQAYEEYFALLIGDGPSGMLIYIGVTIAATVAAPLASLPLVPLASSLWGAPITVLASIIGWFIGALIDFFLSRRYGRALVESLVSKERLVAIEGRIPEKNLFWSIVLLRMAVPVDVLSYALGLVKAISWRVYVPATIIGIVPFAFVFAYLGALPFTYQASIVLVSFVLVLYINKKAVTPPSLSRRT